tara:strand:+ start:174 stop:2036 length:1863 start_codon:yes stop_codon:yes gene_type:complete
MTTINGHLISGNNGFKSKQVGLYETTSIQKKRSNLIASTSSDTDGFFEFNSLNLNPKNTYYIFAKNRSSILTGLFKSKTHDNLVINDRSTVATGIVFNHFINREHLRGSKSSRRSGWMTYRNLVLSTGKVAGLARRNKATAERLNLLANLNAAAIADPSIQSKLFALTSPDNGAETQTNLEAITTIGRNPAQNAREIFALTESVPTTYPTTSKNIADRNSWLLYFEHYGAADEADSVFFGPGNIALDGRGDLWITNNFRPGTENEDPPFPSVTLPRMKPSGELTGGTPLEGGGIYGSGFGIGVDPGGQVWVGNFGFGASKVPLRGNGNSISLFSKQGEPLSPDGSLLPSRSPSGGYTQGDLLGIQGVVSDKRGNIWIASFRDTKKTPSKVVLYPEGDPNRFVSFEHPALTAPFDIAINAEGDAWVSYKSGGRHGTGGVVQLSYGAADGISSVKTFQSKQLNVPFGIATGSDGSVWVSNNGGSPRYTSKTVSRIDPLTGQLRTFPINSKSFTGPWGVNLDGSNNVYVANFKGLSFSVLCGASEGCPGGVLQGEALSPEGGYDFDGSIMRPTGLEVDSGGNLWVANNYHVKSDLYGQHSIFQAIGLADPVTTPSIGQATPLL